MKKNKIIKFISESISDGLDGIGPEKYSYTGNDIGISIGCLGDKILRMVKTNIQSKMEIDDLKLRICVLEDAIKDKLNFKVTGITIDKNSNIKLDNKK